MPPPPTGHAGAASVGTGVWCSAGSSDRTVQRAQQAQGVTSRGFKEGKRLVAFWGVIDGEGVSESYLCLRVFLFTGKVSPGSVPLRSRRIFVAHPACQLENSSSSLARKRSSRVPWPDVAQSARRCGRNTVHAAVQFEPHVASRSTLSHSTLARLKQLSCVDAAPRPLQQDSLG